MRSLIIAIALLASMSAQAQQHEAMSALYWITHFEGGQARVRYALKPMSMVDCKLKSSRITRDYKQKRWKEILQPQTVLMLQCFSVPGPVEENLKRMELTRDMLEVVHRRQ